MTFRNGEIVGMDELSNFIHTGYKKIYCNPENVDRLSKEFPQLTFTPTKLIEVSTVVFGDSPTLRHIKADELWSAKL